MIMQPHPRGPWRLHPPHPHTSAECVRHYCLLRRRQTSSMTAAICMYSRPVVMPGRAVCGMHDCTCNWQHRAAQTQFPQSARLVLEASMRWRPCAGTPGAFIALISFISFVAFVSVVSAAQLLLHYSSTRCTDMRMPHCEYRARERVVLRSGSPRAHVGSTRHFSSAVCLRARKNKLRVADREAGLAAGCL